MIEIKPNTQNNPGKSITGVKPLKNLIEQKSRTQLFKRSNKTFMRPQKLGNIAMVYIKTRVFYSKTLYCYVVGPPYWYEIYCYGIYCSTESISKRGSIWDNKLKYMV
jgi:hypothetical protein